MEEEKIKEAFSKAKEDIFALGKEVGGLKLLISDMKNDLKILTQAFKDTKKPTSTEKNEQKQPTNTPTHPEKNPTNQQIIPTHNEIPTDKVLSQVLKGKNLDISTGNGGVPTDRQTDRQTDRHIIQHIKPQKTEEKKEENHLEKAAQILDNLDALKKEIRIKIKRLTDKEMQVFSLLYSLEDQGQIVDYPLLSTKFNLSESSIRDYIGKIQAKGMPIIKEKIQNKKIILHISQDLRKIASLDTILKLREI